MALQKGTALWRVEIREIEGEGEHAHPTLLACYRAFHLTGQGAIERALRRLPSGSRRRATHATAVRTSDGALAYWNVE